MEPIYEPEFAFLEHACNCGRRFEDRRELECYLEGGVCLMRGGVPSFELSGGRGVHDGGRKT